MAKHSIEISIRGKWFTVPALNIDGKDVVVRGRWIKKAEVWDEEWLDTEVSDPEACVSKLKAERSPGLRADIFTFAQKQPGASRKFSYSAELDSVAAVHLTTFKAWWEGLPQETRKNVRRAEKRGLVVSAKKLDDALVKDIMGVNNDSPLRQGVPFVHYGKSFEQVKKDQSSFLDRSDFVCAYFENEMVGFLKLVYRGEVASILQILPKASHQDKRPANALIAKAVELCAAREVKYLTYGMFNYGNKQDSPLREFKVRNGFEEMLTPRFYVPLTMWGRLCVKIKLHRGLLGILPHGLITVAVSARTRWYTRKQSTGRRSSTSERSNRNRQMERSIPPAGSNV